MSIYKERIEWIKESVNSILSQTYRDYEFIIIVDNPKVSDEVRLFLEKTAIEDNRICVYYNETNIGLALSLNKAIENSKGQYIARMDADDISLPTRFEKEINCITKENADLVFTNRIIIDEDGNEIKRCDHIQTDIPKALMYANIVLHPSVMMRKEIVVRNNGYRNFKRSQDYDLWLRLLSDGCKFKAIDEYLMLYRVSKGNLTRTNKLEQYYTHKFQKQLYIERLHNNGVDSFSEETFQDFLRKKNITDKRNKKAIACFDYLEKCRDSKGIKDRIKYGLLSIFTMPTISFEVLVNHMRKTR